MPKVSSKGQVTIPHQIRTILSIRAGDEIVFEIDNAKAVLKRKSASIENLKKYVGFLAHLNGKKPTTSLTSSVERLMILAVDTNILLDILIPNTAYLQSSLVSCQVSIDG